MAAETYYWIDQSSNFGGGKNSVKYGEEMPKVVSDEKFEENLGKPSPSKCISQSKFDSLKKANQISTEKVATKRELNELEALRAENIVLKNTGGEDSKLVADNALLVEKVAELEKGGSGITQEQLDTASAASVQADLDKIEELEGEVISSGNKSVQADLDKIEEVEGLLKSANSQSLQSDLDRITELEGGDAQGTLDLIKEALSSTQQGDSKAEIWDAVKSIKDLIEEA